jgi:hypothetical protein
VDAKATTDERGLSGRRRRVVLAPRCRRQVLEKQASQGRRWQESPVTGEREISRKPSRRESWMPPLNLYARVRLFMCILHTRPRVQRAPGFPCALFAFRGPSDCKTSGASRREIAEVRIIHVTANNATKPRSPGGSDTHRALSLYRWVSRRAQPILRTNPPHAARKRSSGPEPRPSPTSE